jgi:DnaJ-domain-containing protein 1
MNEVENKLEDKSNNEILFEIKQMEADYEAIKIRMVRDFDKLEELERKFDKANKLITRRLKGEA